MMASRSAPRSTAQRRVVTYSKTSREKRVDAATASVDPSRTANLYDFPDSDESTSPRPRSSAPSAAKNGPTRQSRDGQSGPKKATSGRLPAKGTGDGNSRKRKHANSTDGDTAARKHAPTPDLPSASSSSRPKQERPIMSPARKIPEPRLAATANLRKIPGATTPAQAAWSGPAVQDEMHPRPISPSDTPAESVDNTAGTPIPRKPRLIDRLSALKSESSDSEAGAASESEDDRDSIDVTSPSQTPSQTPSKRTTFLDREIWTRPTHSQVGAPASKKIRHTYSQARSIRGDSQQEGDIFGLSGDIDHDALLSSPSAKPSPGAFALPADEFDLDEDDDDDPKIAIKSVHELRRAGANNRFADEMEDLLSRIGTPGHPTTSLRRNALLELAQKLQRKDFASQFRDHSARDNVATDIGSEEDVVSGFAMTASLVIFLSSNNAPHLLRRLVEERVGKLLGHLLRSQEDVEAIASQRRTNLSKIGRNSISGIKAHLQHMDIWNGYEPGIISPRRIALQLHHIIQRNLDTPSRSRVLKDLEGVFSSVAEDQARNAESEDLDKGLVILVMEAELGADSTILGTEQLRRRASSSALFLRNALDKWPDDRGEVQSATLKLAIDTTNTEVGAQVFGNENLLPGIARSVQLGLGKVQAAVDSRTLDASMYDGLLLIMGVMINVLEHFPPARTSFDAASAAQLADLFSQSRKSVGDADSEEKSKVSVAVGYLAVILGYLCLEEQGRLAIASRTQGTGITILIDAIREFIGLYRSVDAKVHELEWLVQNLRQHNR